MNLFRKAQNALEQSVAAPGHDETALQQSRFWMRAISWSLMGTTSFALGWLCLAQTEEIVTAPGTLEPIGSVKEIQMPVGGIADQILVKEGDRVKAGEVVMRLDTETSRQKQKSLIENIRLKSQQLQLKQLELERFRSLNRDSLQTINEKLILEREILDRLDQLSKQGASAELQYLQQRNSVKEVEGKLRETRLDGLRQEAILNQDMQKLRSEESDLEAQLTETNVTLRYQSLRSPVNGIVFDLKPKSRGYAAQGTESVMKIVPFNALEAKVEIDSSEIGFVRKGMPAEISIDSFPATDFGVLEGKVWQISSDALPPDPAKQQTHYRYPSMIQLSSQQLRLKNGQRLPLQVGMSLHANIKLRKVTYLQMLLGGFKDKADSLRRI
ncbi:MAG: HlyD family efflux transporter periplasmic adaptor subunit [Synechococcus sp. ELA057]